MNTNIRGNVSNSEDVYAIYTHIQSMCGHPNPSEACRLVLKFCQAEKIKIKDGNINYDLEPKNRTKSKGAL